jgi:ubiquinone/menaquinone biosynthesis C-methylase UbiE
MLKFNQIQNNYDRLSRWYDLIEGWGEKSICVDAIKLINIQSGEKILEVGSGTGTNLLRISNTLKNCEIVGLDLSIKMCQQAKIKTKRINDYPLGLVNGNGIHLPFPENYFDVLYLLFTLEIIPSEYISYSLSECKRVLKPDGRICVSAMSAEKKNHLMMRMYQWSIVHFPEVVDCQPIDLESIMKNAGFEPLVNQFQLLWGLPVRILLAKKSSRNEDEDTDFSN